MLAACQDSSTGAAAPASAPAAAVSASSAGSAPLATASTPASAASQTAAGVLLKGIYTWGPEVETIAPCNSEKTFWLEGNDTLLAPLQDLALQKADKVNEAYQPVYVEIRASDAGKATDGFAVEYDGVYHLEQVISSSAEIPAHCTQPAASKPPSR